MLYKYKSVEKHFVFITSKFVFGIFNDLHRHVVLGKMWILDPRRKIHLRQMYLSILLRSSAGAMYLDLVLIVYYTFNLVHMLVVGTYQITSVFYI